jgi:hypothetical protein
MAWERERLSPIVRFGCGVFAVCAIVGGGAIVLEMKDTDELMYVVVYAILAIGFAYAAIAGQFPSIPKRPQ